MDVTISQFILEEFDVNCSLLDRLHETFLESSSVPFLGFDGRNCYLVQSSGKALEALRFGLFCDAKCGFFVLSQLLLFPFSVWFLSPQVRTAMPPRTRSGPAGPEPLRGNSWRDPARSSSMGSNTTPRVSTNSFLLPQISCSEGAWGHPKYISIKENLFFFPWESTFPPHSSLYFQNSCL